MDSRMYVTIALIILAQNSYAVSKELSLSRWRSDDTDFSYLALLKCGPTDKETLCSGSIPSASTVLSYCPCNDTTDTKAYAGLLDVNNATENPEGDIQLRKVSKVDTHPNETNLKVFYVSENWDLNGKVGSIQLRLNTKRRTSEESCKVLGFGSGTAHAMDQMIGGSDQCSREETMENRLYSNGQALSELDRGGPAVCSGDQWGVSVEVLTDQTTTTATGASSTSASSSTTTTTTTTTNKPNYRRGSRGIRRNREETAHGCNTYVNIIFYRDWLRDKMSSGQSSHRYSKKISEYQVFVFLTLAIQIILLY